MILREEEPQRLWQLRDRDHKVVITPSQGGHDLPDTPENQWAINQVLDWRAQHDPLCHCWKKAA